MAELPDWLPPLYRLEDCSGDWYAYIEACYAKYCADLAYNDLELFDKPVETIADPMRDGKEETFWHIVEGRNSDKNEQDIGRCERITWILPIIEAVGKDSVKWWYTRRTTSGKRRSQSRLIISLLDFSYVVILRESSKKFFVITAYPVKRERRRKSLETEYKNWVKHA